VTKTIIDAVGANVITLIYKEIQATVIITGLAADTTTESGYIPTKIDLKYPEASFVNHRFRGPMESDKLNNYAFFLKENLNELFGIYNDLENQYKTITNSMTRLSNTGTNTLNECTRLSNTINKWAKDKRLYPKANV
jgi:hypothetical protein